MIYAYLCLRFYCCSQVKVVIFDKTGTLTIGKPIVVGTKLFKDIRLHDFYDKIAAVEVTSCSFLRIQKLLFGILK